MKRTLPENAGALDRWNRSYQRLKNDHQKQQGAGLLDPKDSTKRTDLIVLIALVLSGFAYGVFTANKLIGKSLVAGAVFILPCVLYLGWREPKPWRKIIISSLVFGALFGFFFDFIQEFTQTYTVISRVFPKVLGVVPVDNVLGHLMMALLTFAFYEHFVNQEPNKVISPRIKYAVYLALGMIALAVSAYYIRPSLLMFSYPYVLFGTLAILPPIIFAYCHPQYVRDFTLMVPFFFFLYLVIEVVAVRYSWWTYPGNNHIGWVSILYIRFPFEELFYWMLFYAVALISYYRIFVDRPHKGGPGAPRSGGCGPGRGRPGGGHPGT